MTFTINQENPLKTASETCTYCEESQAEGYVYGEPVCRDCYEDHHGDIE